MSPSFCPTCGMLSEYALPRSTTPSPLDFELLSVNTPPHESDKSSEEIQFLQSQLIKAQETLSALIAVTSRKNAAAKIILHPMRSLPQDILVEIFLSCAPTVDHRNGEWHKLHGARLDSLSPLSHPWNISHVSRRWRDITLSLPRLWSVMYLDFSRYTQFSSRQCAFMGSLLLERSAKLDLCVNIASGVEGIANHPLTHLLKETTTRWRILNSCIPTISLQSLSGCQFPALQELGIRRQPCVYGEGDVDVDTFKDVQTISAVIFHHSFAGDIRRFKQLPWKKVLKLSCDCFALDPALLPILRQSIGVEDFTVTFHDLTPAFYTLRPHSIILPALERLKVIQYVYSPKQIEQFLHLFRTPAIRDLTLIFDSDRALSFTALVPHPDFHRISTLRITCSMGGSSRDPDYMGGTQALLNFLHPMSGVEEFELKDEEVTCEFLKGLAVGGLESGVVLFPSLRSLDLHECGFEDSEDYDILARIRNFLLRVAESRSAGHDCPCVPLERMILPEEHWLEGFKVDTVEVT
ncbi:hypothetical protein BDZ89DRAFT_1072074 [Hymenopellis radicata]|nr:hypothetical protein BDZ89DRAFT_1072074 [Hymenopellis radicata]